MNEPGCVPVKLFIKTGSGPDVAHRLSFANPCIRATKMSENYPLLHEVHSLGLGGVPPRNESGKVVGNKSQSTSDPMLRNFGVFFGDGEF